MKDKNALKVLEEAVGAKEMVKKCEPLVKDKYDYSKKKKMY